VKLSPDYYRCLEEAKAHHARSKTFSGKFLRPHAPFIKEILTRLDCKSILDYGCGKGSQYDWISPGGKTLEEYWDVPVTKYDPAWPPFEAKPKGTFDLVICTHVLGSIPLVDLSLIVAEISGYTNKALYVAEKLDPIKKRVFSGRCPMPWGFQAQDWQVVLGPVNPELEVTLATRRRLPHGVEMFHHRRSSKGWQRIHYGSES